MQQMPIRSMAGPTAMSQKLVKYWHQPKAVCQEITLVIITAAGVGPGIITMIQILLISVMEILLFNIGITGPIGATITAIVPPITAYILAIGPTADAIVMIYIVALIRQR